MPGQPGLQCKILSPKQYKENNKILLPLALVVQRRKEKSAEIHTVAEHEERLKSLGDCVLLAPYAPTEAHRQPLPCEYPKDLFRSHGGLEHVLVPKIET